jgi:hypothetical protein
MACPAMLSRKSGITVSVGRPTGFSLGLGGVLVLASCLGDPVGPSTLRVVSVLDSPDTAWAGAPGEPLAHPIRIRVVDVQGQPIPGASLNWSVQGRGAAVVSASTATDMNGEGTGEWVLGTNAKELQVLRVSVQTVSSQGQLVIQAKSHPHVVSRVTIPIDSATPLRVGDSITLPVKAVDPYGNYFPAPAPVVTVEDSAIASLSSDRLVGGPSRGRTVVHAISEGVEVSVPLRVTQYVTAIIPGVDTVRVSSVGVTLSVPYAVRDDRDRPVTDTAVSIMVGDTGIVQPSGEIGSLLRDTASVSLVTVANGATHVTLSVPGVSASVQVVVAQVPAAITATMADPKPILTLPLGANLPLTCAAVDSNGAAIPDEPALISTKNGTVSGVGCGGLRVERSGIDTLTVGLGGVRQDVPVIIAVAPVASSPLGEFAVADTLPGQPGFTWAPSARRNEQGDLEVYYSVYSPAPDSSGYTRSDLHRLVWLGGNQFRYDGIAVRHDDDICSPQGQGIENMAILPRTDSSGWRMLYAAGSNVCYGWQVFSAVSGDGRTWKKEPGIRLANEGSIHGPTQWPVGEGMVLDRLPDGEWRMIVGSFEHITPSAGDKWQITEWRSWDQLQWSYVGTVLTTFDMPIGWQGSVYSPTIREVAPGLWRMLFTANGGGTPGGRSAMWSAVSTDRAHWQVEGELLGDVASNLYYAAMVDDQVVFIRQDNGGPMHLSIAHVTMP